MNLWKKYICTHDLPVLTDKLITGFAYIILKRDDGQVINNRDICLLFTV